MVVQFEIEGAKLMGLNGGPMFKINPAISLFVNCTTLTEIENTWSKLSAGGTAMMPLDKYPWAEKYGWLTDKFGMTWQLMLSDQPDGSNKIIPSLLFVAEQYGRAEEAINFYTSIFPDSEIHALQKYQEGETQPAGKLKFGHFNLAENLFSAMDGFGNHEFIFNEAVSLVVECETQEEIDHYWDMLTINGHESRCGWLKDKFGVSWQIIPSVLGSLMCDADRAPRVGQALMIMKKLDIQTLLDA